MSTQKSSLSDYFCIVIAQIQADLCIIANLFIFNEQE